ncbi:ATP-binding protein [Geobacter sp. AOG1]|uniref:ATP-binding protein n=1 Tax=Geobacter sp. AOG1 TaxID=1566346 RepID=UPI001CC3EDE8|nr:ATP-binding protein [Geobacter sp. AOG1]GFE59389.1 hypothetical protein AOG1_32690 [Geobacter sp. AOG1]
MTMRPLRKILSIQSTLVAVVPFLIVAVLGFFWLLPQISVEIEIRQRELASAIASQVESYLAASRAAVEGVAAIHMDKDLTWHDVRHVLDAQIGASPSLQALYVVGPGGRVMAASVPAGQRRHRQDMEGLDLSRSPLFDDVKRQHRPVWSNTFLSVVGGGVSVALAAPSDRLTVVGEVGLDQLTEVLKRTATREGQLIFVIDRRGQVIADQDGRYTAQQLNIRNIPLVREGLASPTPLTGRFRFNDRDMIGSIIESPSIKWDVLVAQPTKAAYRSVVTTTRIVGAGLLISLLLGTTAALIMARQLSLRFNKLATYAHHIAIDEDSPAKPAVNIAEFEQLADDLRQMAEAIHTRERQLRTSERLLQSVMDNTFEYQGLLSPEGILVKANPAALNLIRTTKESVVGRYFWETPWWNHDRALQERIREAVARASVGEFSRFEATHPDGYGNLHYIDFSLTPMKDDTGNVIYLIPEGHDITEQRKTETALRESEGRFRQLFVQNDDALFLIRTENSEVIDVNPMALELYGITREEIVGRTFLSIIAPGDFQTFVESGAISDTAPVFQIERAASFSRSKGDITVSLRGKILTLEDECIVYCSVRDMTEKFHLMEEVRASQAKLIQADKMTSLGLLVSSVAHEINNPNTYISANATMLAQSWRDASPILLDHRKEHGEFSLGGLPSAEMETLVPRLFNGIIDGSRRITEIVNNMREFVKTEKGGRQGIIDINRMIQAATSILWHHIHKHTDHFQMELQPEVPPVRGSGQQIEQVIINLVMNALQSLPDKTRQVWVASLSDQATGQVVITVRDAGKGMNSGELEQLKEPFFTTKAEEGGTGLGLYISDSIIREHGGTIEFQSEPGGGTTATVRLPAASKE